MGTDGRGAIGLCALQKASTWGTAVEAGALDGVLITSSSLTGGKEVIPDETLSGDGYGNAPDIGQEIFTGTVTMPFRYAGRCPNILAGIFGTAGAPSEVESSLEYTHAISLESRLGDFWTWVERRGNVSAWEYAAAKITSLVIEVSGRGRATMDVGFIATGLTRDDSGTNTIATTANVTVQTPIEPIYLGDCRLRLNTQGGGALAGGDTLKPNLIRLTIERGLSEDFKSDQTLGRKCQDPVEEGDVGIFLQLGFPEYQADTYQKWVDAGTEQKADLYITSSTAALTGAASNLYHEYDFDFPRLIPAERPDNAITGPGRIEDGVTFKVVTASANPTGMSSTLPVCTYRNQVNTNLLT